MRRAWGLRPLHGRGGLLFQQNVQFSTRPRMLVRGLRGTAVGILESRMSSVLKAADYSVVERLRDGSGIEIRAIRPADDQEMLEAIGRTSVQSLQRRFFVPKLHFSDKELDFFIHNVDFKDHVALVAELKENGSRVIVGGGRYIMVKSGQAEMAFM